MYAELFRAAQEKVAAEIKKQAFVPIDPASGVPPAAPDPNMQGMSQGGGAPPMDPSMGGGAPPQDPSMGGGAPPQGGAPQGGMDPSQPVQLTLADLMQFMQMMGSGGGGAPAAAQPAAPAAGDAEGSKSKKSGGKAGDNDALSRVESKLDQLAAILTGQMNALSMGAPGGGPPGGGPASPDATGLGAPPMGAGADHNSIPAEQPMVPGTPEGGMPGIGGPGMTAQASASSDGVITKKSADNNALRLNRIISNLRRV